MVNNNVKRKIVLIILLPCSGQDQIINLLYLGGKLALPLIGYFMPGFSVRVMTLPQVFGGGGGLSQIFTHAGQRQFLAQQQGGLQLLPQEEVVPGFLHL